MSLSALHLCRTLNAGFSPQEKVLSMLRVRRFFLFMLSCRQGHAEELRLWEIVDFGVSSYQLQGHTSSKHTDRRDFHKQVI